MEVQTERERERMCSETVCGGYQLLSLLIIIISTNRTAIISEQRNKPDQPGPLHVWSEVAWPGDSRGWGNSGQGEQCGPDSRQSAAASVRQWGEKSAGSNSCPVFL